MIRALSVACVLSLGAVAADAATGTLADHWFAHVKYVADDLLEAAMECHELFQTI